ncbi:MAG: metallophosphoesterase [Candidatus Omnitrophica bacterium]|nr:metallophosphoesterase [Candidatus Omnitrophota bacterium]MDD4012655.1 metallophosphoesterase [Candidatus Omnitrophota bacterium]
MRIGVISDTHIPVTAPELPGELLSGLAGCDLILHAGDIIESSVLDSLRSVAPVTAVRGNMDSLELREKLPDKIIIEAEDVHIGMIHGSGLHSRVISSVSEEFDKQVDIVVFGHTHTPLNEKRGNVLFFNPGSPTDKIFAPYRSFGIIAVNGRSFSGEIIKIGG